MALGVILLLAVLVRMPFLHVPLIADEGGYAYTTHYGLSGRTLYHLLWFDRTQGILWVYRVIFQTLGQSVVAIRLFAAIYNAGSALLVYSSVAGLADKRTGLIAASLFALFSVMPHVQGFTANAELFMTLPALASLALLLPIERTRMAPDAGLLARVNVGATRPHLPQRSARGDRRRHQTGGNRGGRRRLAPALPRRAPGGADLAHASAAAVSSLLSAS